MPQPIPHLQHAMPGAWTPPVNYHPQGQCVPLRQDSSHRSFAKETLWSQQPGTDTSRETVEKGKEGTENILSIQTGLKPFLMHDPSLFQSHLIPSTPAVLHSPPYLLLFPYLLQIFPIPCLSF